MRALTACTECNAPLGNSHRQSGLCRSCARKKVWAAGGMPTSPRNRVTLTCEVCGSSFEVIRARASKARSCSHACANEIRRRLRGDAHPLKKPTVTLTCEQCDETFEAKPCFADGAKGKRFCSRQCTGAWVSGHQPRSSSIEELTAAHLDAARVAYRRQVSIGAFVADFVVESTVIEVDGDYWHSLPKVVERDARKDAFYRSRDLHIVRLTESAIRAGDFSAIAYLTEVAA